MQPDLLIPQAGHFITHPVKKRLTVSQLIAQAFSNLKKNAPIEMAAATAFFSFFALPPIVIILSQLFGGLLSLQDQQVSWQLFHKLAHLFGHQSARELRNISENIQQRQSGSLLTLVSVFLLLLASTTLFSIIKSALNQLWQVKPAADRKVASALLDRLVAIGIIVFSGVLVAASLTIQRLLWYAFPEAAQYNWLRILGHHSLSVLLLTIWFAVVFKFLPDIRIRWRGVWMGALVTAVLIEIGEKILDLLLINEQVSSMYGASGSIILVLLFVFYSSLIFYYGASFTRHYAEWIHQAARPAEDAVAYEVKDVERRSSSRSGKK